MVNTGTCEACGKEFSWYRNRPRTCCSRLCGAIISARTRQNRIKVACDNCGTEFLKVHAEYLKTTRHFCSRACTGQWQSKHWLGKDNPTYTSIDCTCDICGKAFTRTPFHIANGEGKFCSYKCSAAWKSQNMSGSNSPYWLGGEVRYRGANWRRQCDEVRKRDKYRCQRCGIHEKKLGRKLDVHHIVAYRKFARDQYKLANQLTNLISLCHSCHTIVERANIPVQSRFL